jgi:molecular chaperone HtpG
MAADKVRVITAATNAMPNLSHGKHRGTEYTIEAADRAQRGGHNHLSERRHEGILQPWRIKNIVTKHSDYVAFPIYVGDDEKPANKQTALWRQSARDVADEEYKNFYQMMTMDFGEPLLRVHMRADVPMQFYALLYVPSTAEVSPFSPRKDPGLKLYARKVLIDDYNKDLLPEYLMFMQGVVDSEDIPLSVTRESVRANRIMANLKKTITNKVLSELADGNKETESISKFCRVRALSQTGCGDDTRRQR